MHTLIEPKTAAEDSETFKVWLFVEDADPADGVQLPVTVVCDGLGAGETAGLEILAGSTWKPYREPGGALQQFTEDVHCIPIFNPGQYRVNKDVTGAAVGFYLSTTQNP